MSRTELQKDYCAGALCLLLGVATVVIANGYDVGSLLVMGPGYFPIILGSLLMLMGVLIVGTALVTGPEPPDPFDQHVPSTPDWRGCTCICLSVVVFIAMAHWFGMAPAIFFSVLLAAFGDRTSTPLRAGALAAGVTVFGVILFSHLLKVSMPVWLWAGH